MVEPGSATPRQESVIAYAPGSAELVTIDSEEAQAKRLVVIRNPYLDYMRQPMSDPRVQEQAGGVAFECPKCGDTSMRFGFVGFWCS